MQPNPFFGQIGITFTVKKVAQKIAFTVMSAIRGLNKPE
jgi:hypothetical protein